MLFAKLYQASSATSNYAWDFQISGLIPSATCTFWLSIYCFFIKFWNIKLVTGYLFCTGRNVVHIIISSIVGYVGLYQRFAVITLHLVSYLYLLIIIISYFPKILIFKSSILLLMHRKKCYTNYNIEHHLPRQIISYICRYRA